MNKKYSDEVSFLSSQTGLSKKRCRAVLSECDGNMDWALERLTEIADNKYEKAIDNISALVTGERGSLISITEGGESIFKVPCVLVLLVLFLLDVPSWAIAIVLMLFVVFGAEVHIGFTEKEQAPVLKTVSVEEYNKKQTMSKRHGINKKKNTVTENRSDGYNEIIIE